MITVLRRWFVPSDKFPEFAETWQQELMPTIARQPGCVRVEIYESSIREHWVTAVTWQDEESRSRALQALAGGLSRSGSRIHSWLQRRFELISLEEAQRYERFEPEILVLRSHMP